MWDCHQEYSWNAPTLSFGRTIFDNHTFLIPDPAFTESHGYLKDIDKIKAVEQNLKFEEKKKVLFFRGAAACCGMDGPQWAETPRGSIAVCSRNLNNTQILDARMTKISHLTPEQQELLKEAGVIGEYLPFAKFLEYLYLLHVDGYHCSWPSLFTKLASNSLTVRILGRYEQWYYHELTPWRHYVPIEPNLTDVVRVHEWLVTHDDAVREIIAEAHRFLDERLNYDYCLAETEDLCARILDCRR